MHTAVADDDPYDDDYTMAECSSMTQHQHAMHVGKIQTFYIDVIYQHNMYVL